MFYIASSEDIKKGETTDVYFERTKEILAKKGINKRVKVEFIAKHFPNNYPWAVFAGLEEALQLFDNIDVNLRAVAEGTIFQQCQPVLEIEGNYIDFAVYETPLMGFLCQASGIATKAARYKKAAGDKSVISFGARRMHPALSLMIDRSAYIGGCDGVAVRKNAEFLGIEPTGTMPHALVLLLGDVKKAIEAFHEIIDPKVKRVALVDTFFDEKIEAIKAAEALGKELYAVRLDTPGSRRGDFLSIIKEVRWELDIRGFEHVKLFVSGGLSEENILQLNEVVDSYGVGTGISSAATIDFSMDIVEIEDKPISKRGKCSGSKEVLRCNICHAIKVVPSHYPQITCPCGGSYSHILNNIIERGHLHYSLPKPHAIREYVLKQLNWL